MNSRLYQKFLSLFLSFVLLFFQGLLYPSLSLFTVNPALAVAVVDPGTPTSAVYESQFSVSASPTGVTITTDGTVCSGTGTDTATITMISGTGTCTITYDDGLGTLVTEEVAAQKKELTVTGITADNKTYNGTTVAILDTTGATLNGAVGGDVIALDTSGAAGAFSNKHVGTGKVVSVTGLATDANIDNYSLTQPATTADITALALTVTAVTDTKVYDGNTSSDETPAVTGTIQAGDTANFSQVYADKNVGTLKTLTPSGTVTDGNSGNNYSYTFADDTTGTITERNLTVTATGVNKQYDGTTAATVNLTTDKVVTDTVTASSTSATFPDKNIGTGKEVSVSGIAIGGADAGNYNLSNTTASTTANITTYTLTANITVSNKVYDQTTTATITGRSLVGVFGSDDVTISDGTATFDNKNVGTGKAVTATGLTLGGVDAGNYAFDGTAATTANITPIALTVTGITASNKVYDGNTIAVIDTGAAALVSSGVINGDTVTLDTTGGVGVFDNKNVGTGKTVTINDLALGGTDGGNYTVTPPTTTANVTVKELTVSGVTASSKTYDGDTTATLNTGSVALVGIVMGDTIVIDTASAAGAFDNKNVGTGKTVAISGLSISGADSGNYSLTQPTTTADVTAKALSITADNRSKTYGDILTLGTTAFAQNGLVSGDSVDSVTLTSTGSGELGIASVSTYPIVPSDAQGTGLTNYSITYQNGTLTVNQRSVTATASTLSKAYGNSDPSLTYSITAGDLVNSDTFTGELVREQGEDVGVYDILQGTLSLGTNYVLTFVESTFEILARAITVTADNKSKEYGASDPALTYAITTGTLVGQDAFAGAITRVAGETLGTFAINQGTLALSSNYDLTFNVGTFSVVDTTAPSAGTLEINSGAAFTSVTSVTLTISGTDIPSGVTEMLVYNGNTPPGSPVWETFATTKSWILNADEGNKIVSLRLRDAEGNENTSRIAFDGIILDATPPVATADTGANNPSLVATRNTALDISDSELLENDTDANPLTITDVSSGVNGAVSHSGTTTTFTPTNDFVGEGSFIYTVFDGVNTATASATVKVNPPVSSGQTLLDEDTTVSESSSQVVVGNTATTSTVTVPSTVTNASLDVSSLISSGTSTAVLNGAINVNTTTSLGIVTLQIPASTEITGPSDWNGVINIPQIRSNTSISSPVPSSEGGVTAVIEVGFGDVPLTLSNAVRLVLPGQAGRNAAYVRSGVLTNINTVCSADTQAAGDSLPAAGDCNIDNGSDLVIWTKHFTQFVAYTHTPLSTSGPAMCSDSKPTATPTLLSAVAGANSVTLTWSDNSSNTSYYVVTYGDASGRQQYGNNNIGGKGTTSYTVSGLSGGTTYYFRVRNGNGCATGEYSGELSATPGGAVVQGPATGFQAGVLGVKTQGQVSYGPNGEVLSAESAEINNSMNGETVNQFDDVKTPSENKNGLIGIIFGAIASFFARLFGR